MSDARTETRVTRAGYKFRRDVEAAVPVASVDQVNAIIFAAENFARALATDACLRAIEAIGPDLHAVESRDE